MFWNWGYLIWLILAVRLLVYAGWLWRNGYRLGTFGVLLVMACTLATLILGTFIGSGLD